MATKKDQDDEVVGDLAPDNEGEAAIGAPATRGKMGTQRPEAEQQQETSKGETPTAEIPGYKRTDDGWEGMGENPEETSDERPTHLGYEFDGETWKGEGEVDGRPVTENEASILASVPVQEEPEDDAKTKRESKETKESAKTSR